MSSTTWPSAQARENEVDNVLAAASNFNLLEEALRIRGARDGLSIRRTQVYCLLSVSLISTTLISTVSVSLSFHTSSSMSSSQPLNPSRDSGPLQSSDEEPVRKRLKLDDTTLEVALQAAQTLRSQLELLQERLKLTRANLPDDLSNQVLDLLAMVNVFLRNDGNLEIHGNFFDSRLPPAAGLERIVDMCNEAYDHFCVCYGKHKHQKPSPSDFAADWGSALVKVDHLLCCRPSRERGIPISTLHDVFRVFTIQAESPLPLGRSVATQALRAAYSLCDSMGGAYSSRTQRSNEFDRCTRGLFNDWRNQRYIASPDEACSGFVGRTLESAGRILVFREDAGEIGYDGEVYMQVARDYDIYRQTYSPIEGAPAFLVCVIGPILAVSGAFYDGSNAVIEPLIRPCFMLADETNRRKNDLAQVLYALHCGIESLKKLTPTPQRHQHKPLTPRIYPDCMSIDDNAPLGSLKDWKLSHFTRRMSFSALLTRSNLEPERVFIKLIPQAYGEKVHKLLASRGYAPKLYGRKVIEGAPTAFIMEHLESHWTPLYDLSQSKYSGVFKSPTVRTAIADALYRILSILEEARMVHGDFRSNNIMIKLDADKQLASVGSDGAVELKVVDFDWSGDAGVVRYPASRNPDIPHIKWPGVPGGPIQAKDDRQLFESWWPHFPTV